MLDEVGEQDDDAERDSSPSLTSGISSAVFMGNFLLFAAVLAAIFLFHIVMASAVEAYWLSKVRVV